MDAEKVASVATMTGIVGGGISIAKIIGIVGGLAGAIVLGLVMYKIIKLVLKRFSVMRKQDLVADKDVA